MISSNTTGTGQQQSSTASSGGDGVWYITIASLTLTAIVLVIIVLCLVVDIRGRRQRRREEAQQEQDQGEISKKHDIERAQQIQDKLKVFQCTCQDCSFGRSGGSDDGAHSTDGSGSSSCESRGQESLNTSLNGSVTIACGSDNEDRGSPANDTTLPSNGIAHNEADLEDPQRVVNVSFLHPQWQHEHHELGHEKENEGNDDFCSICLAQFVKLEMLASSKNLACKHVFHQKCIASWLMKCNGCPVCRQSFLEADI
jgi:Ring finger domain